MAGPKNENSPSLPQQIRIQYDTAPYHESILGDLKSMKRKNVRWEIKRRLMNEVDLSLCRKRNSIIAQDAVDETHMSIRDPIDLLTWVIAIETTK